MGESKSSDGKQTQSSFGGILFCAFLIGIAAFVIQTRDSPPLNEYLSKTVALTKPYATFEEFYPHYLREHSQETTRQWHYVGTVLFIIYVLINPLLVLSVLTAGLVAYAAVPFLRHLSDGLYEMGLLLTIYLVSAKLLTRSFRIAIIPLLLGYGFAWIGHFYFENNKPATFIYPAYSLMGDFHMAYDAIKRLLNECFFLIR